LSALLATPRSIPPTNLALIAAFVCYGMAYLESNQLVHGTLHSGNIFITEDFIPIITDYGLARGYDYFYDDEQSSQIAWISPEVLLENEVNYSIDIYSYGILLFEIFEGRRPFADLTNVDYLVGLRSGRVGQLRFESTPADWQAVIRRCTDRTPGRRPSFLELYQGFRNGTYAFPGVESATFRAVLDQFPIHWISRPENPLPRVNLDLVEGFDILSNPSHPQFEEYIQYLELRLPIDGVIRERHISPCLARPIRRPTRAVSSFRGHSNCPKRPPFPREAFQEHLLHAIAHIHDRSS
jgi:serine/threonine protein kinase